MVAAGPPSPSLAEISRNTSVISSSSSSSTSSLVLESEKTRKSSIPVPVRPTRTFAAPTRALGASQSQSQASLLPGYIQRELGISSAPSSVPSSPPLRDAGVSALQKQQQPRGRFNSPQDFEFGDILGHGSFSTVIQATGKKSGRTYAIKVLDKAHLQRHNQRRTAYAEKDALVALGLSHPGIVGLHSTFSDAWSLYFVLDLLPNGDLRALISRYGSLSLECTRYYIAQLTDTIAFMHSKNVMHRDIKPENLLLDSRFRLALADFGTAKVLPPPPLVPIWTYTQNLNAQSEVSEPPEQAESSSSKTMPPRRSNTFVGTPQYYSPELLAHSYTSPASDLWALGCVLFELHTGTFAFNGASPLLTWRLIKELKYEFPEGFDGGAQDLVQKLLLTTPEERLGAGGLNGMKDLKGHIFFQNVEWDKIWDISHPKLVSGLKVPPEPVAGPVSDEELGAQLRDERLRDEDGDEISWAKDARLAAYLPGLRHTGASAINYRSDVVADDVSTNDYQRATENGSLKKYNFPMLEADAEDGGLPYSLPSQSVTSNSAVEYAVELEKNAAGPVNISTEAKLGTSVTKDAEGKPEHLGAIPSLPVPVEFLHILKPAETILIPSALILDTTSPTFTRILPKLLSGSKRKPKEQLLLTTHGRLLCVGGSGKGAVVSQEFAVGNSQVAPLIDSGLKLVINGAGVRGRRLTLLTNDGSISYILDDAAVASKLARLIHAILRSTESIVKSP